VFVCTCVSGTVGTSWTRRCCRP